MGLDPTVAEVLRYSVQQARAAIPSSVRIGLYLPDAKGRLHLAQVDGDSPVPLSGQRVSLRQSVFETATSKRMDLERNPGCAWLGIPLASHGRAYGVLTVIAARSTLTRKTRLLEVIAAQAGAVLAASASVREHHEQLGLGLACTAHELRSPVVAAQVAIAYALQQGVSNPDSSDLLRRSQRELEDLSSRVDAMLRLGAGDPRLDESLVDLLEITRDAVASCTWESGGEGVNISATDGPRVSVRGDRAQLKTAIANLVRNALAHAPPGTNVEIEIHANDGRVRLAVADRGPGVADEDRWIIFEPFAQGADGPRSEENRGLGLFIARQIVEAHGGGISVGPGPGATFVIEWPPARVLQARAS